MTYFDFQILINQIYNSILGFFGTTTFSVIKFILGIYALVLLIDIVLLLIKRNVGGNIRQMMLGMDVPREITSKKKAMAAAWKKLKLKLDSQNESEYKVAIIEADKAIDDVLIKMSFAGENMGERLEAIPPGQLDSLASLKKAHEVRNRIIHEEGFQVSQDFAKEVFGLYEEFLKEFSVLD